MIVEEQVAARMYTGPMYMKYNLVLRGMGAGRHTKIHEEYERVCKLNTYARRDAFERRRRTTHTSSSPRSLPLLLRYTTTLHVINSAIIKLSKLTSATKLYRGVSGALLPRPFWTPNQYNVRGGVEVALLSSLGRGASHTHAQRHRSAQLPLLPPPSTGRVHVVHRGQGGRAQVRGE